MNQKSGIIIFRVLIILFSVVQPVVLGAEDIKIGIVKSSDNSYYNTTIQALLNNANRAAQFSIVEIKSDSNELDRIAESDLIISLGASATSIVSSQYPGKKLISAYLTSQQASLHNLSKQQHIAVLLDQPLLRYLAFCHLLLNADSIGLINFDAIELNPIQQRFLLKHDVILNQRQVQQPEELLTALRQLVRRNSSLLMLPDQRLYNRNSLKGVLLTTYRSRKPVISYSPAHVKSGALASIYSSPEDIGNHLGDLLNQFIDKKSLPDERRVFAKYYSITVNTQVAHALDLNLPDTGQLKQRLDEVLQ